MKWLTNPYTARLRGCLLLVALAASVGFGFYLIQDQTMAVKFGAMIAGFILGLPTMVASCMLIFDGGLN